MKVLKFSRKTKISSHSEIAEKIHTLLNEGNLYAISEITEGLNSNEETRLVVEAFIKKYEFDFRNYI